MVVNSAANDAMMVFFPFEEEDSVGLGVDEAMTTRSPVIAHRDILSLQTMKPKTGAGTFSAVLSSQDTYGQKIQPGCWCMIFISDKPISEQATSEISAGLKMVGIVKSVRTVENTIGNGTMTVRYEVSGEDFHSILNTLIYVNATLKARADGTDIADAIILLGDEFQKTVMKPHELMFAMVQSLLGESFVSSSAIVGQGAKAGMPLTVPQAIMQRVRGSSVGSNRYADLLEQTFQDNLIGQANVQPNIGSTFSIWSMLETYAHRLLNELYTDLLPLNIDGQTRLVPSLILRAIPFSSKSATDLDASVWGMTDTAQDLGLYVSRTVAETDIMSINHGRSDHERFNFFMVVPILVNDSPAGEAGQLSAVLDKAGGINNLGDIASIARYGMKPYITASNYLLNEDNDTAGTVTQIVKDIWEKAYLYESGTATIRGSEDHIPVGSNVIFKERGWLAHVESVGHEFRIDKDTSIYRTQIAFVRLQTTGGTPISQVATPPQRGSWDRGVDKVYAYSPPTHGGTD